MLKTLFPVLRNKAFPIEARLKICDAMEHEPVCIQHLMISKTPSHPPFRTWQAPGIENLCANGIAGVGDLQPDRLKCDGLVC